MSSCKYGQMEQHTTEVVMFVRSSRLLFLKCENTEGKPSNLARKSWGQLLGGSTIEGDLDGSVGTEGCGINTATLCVRGRSRMGSDGTGAERRRNEAWKLRCSWNGRWRPAVEQPQNILNPKRPALFSHSPKAEVSGGYFFVGGGLS